MKNIVDTRLKERRSEVEKIIGDLFDLSLEIAHEDWLKLVKDLKNRIHEPFMFVIVGEVKSGKSSFINALLDTNKEICKVAAHPMTDKIQQIVYGEEEKTEYVSEHQQRIYQNVDILKDIAIVDTPGTNAIIEHHQEITENFVPASDLIVFVFEAKNPYRQSSWDFFDFIRDEWRKKVIFILQQKDLMNEVDLQTNLDGVLEYAAKKGITEAKVFAVSAKDELEGKKDSSGFEKLRGFINENITGGQAPYLKLENHLSTAEQINKKIDKALEIRKAQFVSDFKFRDDIKSTLENQKGKSNYQVDVLIENLVASYEKVTRQKESELAEGISFFSMLKRSIRSVFNKEVSIKNWLNQFVSTLEKDMNGSLKEKLNQGVVDIADSIQQMGKLIDLKIKNSETILKNDHEIFSDIAERRSNVLKELQQAFANFLSRTENFYDDNLLNETGNLTPNVATGSGIAIVGVILTTVTNGVVFDITGGILTTVGLLFAGVSIGLKKRKILKDFRIEINHGRERIKNEVNDKLKSYITRIGLKIDANFNQFDDHLHNEERALRKLNTMQTEIDKKISSCKTGMAELIKSL